jgi:hypothetical protein
LTPKAWAALAQKVKHPKAARRKFGWTAVALLLSCCHSGQSAQQRGTVKNSAPSVVNTELTRSALERMASLVAAKKMSYALPQVRLYDGERRLVLNLVGFQDGATREMDAALRSRRALAGPSYGDTMADLQTDGGEPAEPIASNRMPIVFDYWASWCIPCRKLDGQLRTWASQPGIEVRIVRVEADLTKLERARGGKVYLLKKGADGKLHKVEMH